MIKWRLNGSWRMLCALLASVLFCAGLASAEDGAAAAAAGPKVEGEVFCVLPDGATYGRGDGSDWDNAFSGLPKAGTNGWGDGAGQIGAGDTVMVGGGEYRQAWSVGAGGTADDRRVTIRRATQAEHGPEAGWKKEMDGQVRLMGPAHFSISGMSFVTLDGVSDEG